MKTLLLKSASVITGVDGSQKIDLDRSFVEETENSEPEEEQPILTVRVTFTKDELELPKEEFVNLLNGRLEFWKPIIIDQNDFFRSMK